MYRKLFQYGPLTKANWRIRCGEETELYNRATYAKQRLYDGEDIVDVGCYFREKGIHGFSLCLVAEERKASRHSFGFYVEMLIELAGKDF